MTYQTFFDEGPGHSDSIAKLNALNLPERMDGMSLLDIGCNEGFFCFEAKKRGAIKTVGVDTYQPYIDKAVERAKKYGISSDFKLGDAFSVTGQFDFILVLSVLHYIKDPAVFFERVYSLLKPGGTLIFEGGVHSSNQDLTRVFRDDRDYYYPSLGFLTSCWLSKFEVIKKGDSVRQPGDPVGRQVFHCRPIKHVYLVEGHNTWSPLRASPETQHLNADNIFLPSLPRSLARVPEPQKAIFAAAKDVDFDVVATWHRACQDKSVVDYVANTVATAINRNGGVKYTILSGQVVPMLADALKEQLTVADGFRVSNVTSQVRASESPTNVDTQSTKEIASIIQREGIAAWAERYVLTNRAPNIELYNRITMRPGFWLGPIELDVNDFTPMAGPNRKYHEDQEIWDRRANEIVAIIEKSSDLPPVIASVKREADRFELIIVDGAHRHEAFRRVGASKIPAVLWFDSEGTKESFIAHQQESAR